MWTDAAAVCLLLGATPEGHGRGKGELLPETDGGDHRTDSTAAAPSLSRVVPGTSANQTTSSAELGTVTAAAVRDFRRGLI